MTPSAMLAGILAAAALVGCGGGKGEPAENAAVRGALERFDRAQASGDARATCNEVAVEEQGRIEVPGEEGKRGDGETASAPDGAESSAEPDAAASACERAVTQAAASRKQLRDVATDVTSIEVKGDRASAQVRTRLTRPDGSRLDQAAVRRLVRLDGRWRLLITEE